MALENMEKRIKKFKKGEGDSVRKSMVRSAEEICELIFSDENAAPEDKIFATALSHLLKHWKHAIAEGKVHGSL